MEAHLNDKLVDCILKLEDKKPSSYVNFFRQLLRSRLILPRFKGLNATDETPKQLAAKLSGGDKLKKELSLFTHTEICIANLEKSKKVEDVTYDVRFTNEMMKIAVWLGMDVVTLNQGDPAKEVTLDFILCVVLSAPAIPFVNRRLVHFFEQKKTDSKEFLKILQSSQIIVPLNIVGKYRIESHPAEKVLPIFSSVRELLVWNGKGVNHDVLWARDVMRQALSKGVNKIAVDLASRHSFYFGKEEMEEIAEAQPEEEAEPITMKSLAQELSKMFGTDAIMETLKTEHPDKF